MYTYAPLLVLIAALCQLSVQLNVSAVSAFLPTGQSLLVSSDDVYVNTSTNGGALTQSPTIIPVDNPTQLAKRLHDIDQLDVSPFLSYSPQYDEDQSSLRQVILIHRHGDRTPYEFAPKDPLRHEPFWKFHGLGHMTNRGKARVFRLGRIVRERYDQFLNYSVNKNQRISRSSGILRCIESAQVFLSGFMGLNLPGSQDASELQWDDPLNNPLASLWQPVGIQSVPAPFDAMLAGPSCEKIETEHNKVINSSAEVRAIFANFQHEGQVLADVLGYEMDSFWKWFEASSTIAMERSYFPDKMPDEIMQVYDRLMEAGALAMGAYQSTLTAKRLRAGLLINDMVRHVNKFKEQYSEHEHDGGSTIGLKKFVHYSAHDTTILVLLGMFDFWHKFNVSPPDFASNIVIELHQDKSEWFVRIFYMAQVPANYVELHLDRCESEHPANRCTLDRFTQLMGPYMIDSWHAWMQECGNDIAKMDLYTEGS